MSGRSVLAAITIGGFMFGYQFGYPAGWAIGTIGTVILILSFVIGRRTPIVQGKVVFPPEQPHSTNYNIPPASNQASSGDYVEGHWTYDQPTAAPPPRSTARSAPRPAPAAEEGQWHLYYRKMDAQGRAKGERHEVLDSEQLCYDRLELYGSNEIGYARPFYLHSARIVSPGNKTTTINVANYPRPRR
jgi:hypothetical protein